MENDKGKENKLFVSLKQHNHLIRAYTFSFTCFRSSLASGSVFGCPMSKSMKVVATGIFSSSIKSYRCAVK